jgi:spore germination cell wall hydrolase CwlJ-like protein
MPNEYTTMASTPPVSLYERSYEEMNARVAQENKEASCMAKALYWEAKGETKKGMTMVGLVILNRTKSPKYANTVCGVIKERNAFQWYKHSKKNKPKEHSRYLLAQAVAKDLLSGKHNGKMASSVLWFKVCDHPSEFFTKLKMAQKIGQHCFYREGKV